MTIIRRYRPLHAMNAKREVEPETGKAATSTSARRSKGRTSIQEIRSAELIEAAKQCLAELGLDDWTMDAARLDRGMGAALSGPLHLAMLVNGVDTSRGNSNGWMNGAMTDKDIDQIVDAFDRSLARLQEERRLA